jgi:hypothetical protein
MKMEARGNGLSFCMVQTPPQAKKAAQDQY